MPLPNPYCGFCKSNARTLFYVFYVNMWLSWFYQGFSIWMLYNLFSRGKLEAASGIVIGVFISFGAVVNVVLQCSMVDFEGKQTKNLCRLWLILRVMADWICFCSVYYFLSQWDGTRGFGLMIVFLSVPSIFHVYAWYVVLVFTYKLQLDSIAPVAAPALPPVVIVASSSTSTMPLPNPFCGICKLNRFTLLGVIIADIVCSVLFLFFIIGILITLSERGKLETVSEIVIGVVIFFGGVLNLILQLAMTTSEFKKTLRNCRTWLIIRVMSDGICSYSLYYFLSQSGSIPGYDLIMFFMSAPIIIHVYAWYVVLVFTYQLHLDEAKAAAAAAAVPPSGVIVEGGTNSHARQQFGTTAVQKPNSTGTGTNAPNPNSILSSGDDNNNNDDEGDPYWTPSISITKIIKTL